MFQPNSRLAALLLLVGTLAGCEAAEPAPSPAPSPPVAPSPRAARLPGRQPRDYKVVHVFVALCDNEHQGIVKVPPALGNGKDPANNLYWGALYGVKTFFAKSSHWTLIKDHVRASRPEVLERCVFRSKRLSPPVYVVADAFDGKRMTLALTAFLKSAAGRYVMKAEVGDPDGPAVLQAGAHSDLVAFVGHNGLMDCTFSHYFPGTDGPKPVATVVLACKSHPYFQEPLRQAKCPPLITTRQFMAPEAYTLDAILRSWAAGEPPETVRRRAADAYAQYQKCSRRAALGIFVAGRAD